MSLTRFGTRFGVAAAALVLCACGGGGGGGGAAPPTSGAPAPGGAADGGGDVGSVALFFTDAPTARFDRILVDVERIVLLGDERAPVTVFEGRETLDLKQLETSTELFVVDDGVPAGRYEKIRLYIDDLVLVDLADDGTTVAEEIRPRLPANGKLDLNPRGEFTVSPGETLLVQIDIDAEKSIKFVETGNGEWRFRPVIFVDLGDADDFNRLTRVYGRIDAIDETEEHFRLCQTELLSDDDDDDDFDDDEHCLKVRVLDDTGLFGESGDPIFFADFAAGDFATVVGFARDKDDDKDDVAVMRDGDDDDDDDDDRGRGRGNGNDDDDDDDDDRNRDGDDDDDDDENRRDDDDEDDDDDDDYGYFAIDAAVVMQGVKGTFETFKGRVEDGLDEATGEFALDLEPGQPVETDGPLTALFQDGTRVFERKGRPLDAGAIVAGARGHFDGRLVLSDSEPDLLRTALIVLELAPEGETVLRGDIASLEAGGFVLITSQGDRCVDIGDDTEVFLIVPEGDDGVRSERGEIADLADGQQVDVYGEEDTDGCLDAGTIVVDDTFEEVPPANQPPVASAGPDVTIDVGESVMLDGSGSSDPEGEPLIYAWTLEPPDGSTASLAGADTAMPSFTADVAGDYVAELTVDDGELTATDTAIVTASEATVNQAPVADAGPDQTVEVGTTVTLDGTGSSDPDGDALSYRWTLSVPDGSSAALDDASVATPTFTPDVAGVYNATLVVDDGELEAAADDVAITAEEATAGIDGVALWEDNCAACHGDIAAPSNWPIRFPTAEEIQAAIEAGTGGMGSTRLRALTAEEIRAIADAISAAGGGS